MNAREPIRRPARIKADYNGSARRYARALLLLAIAGLLNACGGGGSEPGPGGDPVVACITGPASAVLTWDAVTGAAGYRIHYGTTSGMYLQVQDAGILTTHTVTGLSSGTTYHFVVTAYDSSTPPNESSFSNAVCKSVS